MSQTKPVAVVGASGGVGAEVVKQLLAAQWKVVAVGRSAERLNSTFSADPNLSVVQGDVENIESLKSAFSGVGGVVNASSGKSYFSASKVDYQGSGNVATAAKAAGVEHVVMVSSALVTKQNRFHPIRILLNNIRWGLMDAKLKGEQLVRESGVPFTIVRPGGLTNEAGGKQQLVVAQGDLGSPGRVSRADVAAVCIAALQDPDADRKTFELSAKPAEGTMPDQLKGLFKGTTADA